MPYEDRRAGAARIHGAMVAFAAGDALGVPWEGRPPRDVDPDAVTRLPAPGRDPRDGWSRGSTSDDTAQMTLAARWLTDGPADAAGRPTSLGYLTRLAEAAPGIRGIGPTTHRALAHFRATGEPPVRTPDDRPTNGAAMRVAPVGWAVPPRRAERRRSLCEALSAATHRAPAAVAAACVIAAMASWAVEGVEVTDLLDVAADEARWAGEHFGLAEDRPDTSAGTPLGAVAAAARGRWSPPPEGVSLDAVETVAAVVHVIRQAPDLAAALPYAVSLGGDTDTVAALVGGVLGAREPGRVPALGWLELVDLGEYPGMADLAGRLAVLRAGPARPERPGRPGRSA